MINFYYICSAAVTNRIGARVLTDYKGKEVDNFPNDVQDTCSAADDIKALGLRNTIVVSLKQPYVTDSVSLNVDEVTQGSPQKMKETYSVSYNQRLPMLINKVYSDRYALVTTANETKVHSPLVINFTSGVYF